MSIPTYEKIDNIGITINGFNQAIPSNNVYVLSECENNKFQKLKTKLKNKNVMIIIFLTLVILYLFYMQYFYQASNKAVNDKSNSSQKNNNTMVTKKLTLPPPVQTKLEPYYEQDSGHENFETYIPQRNKYENDDKLDRYFSNSNGYSGEPQPFIDSSNDMFIDHEDIDSDAEDLATLPHFAPPLRPAIQ